MNAPEPRLSAAERAEITRLADAAKSGDWYEENSASIACQEDADYIAATGPGRILALLLDIADREADATRLADENAKLRTALAGNARADAILAALLVARGDPEDGPRDHLPRSLRDYLAAENVASFKTGWGDGYAEGHSKADADCQAEIAQTVLDWATAQASFDNATAEIAELRAERDRLAAALAEREKDDGRAWCAGRDAAEHVVTAFADRVRLDHDPRSIFLEARQCIRELVPPLAGSPLSPDAKENRHG